MAQEGQTIQEFKGHQTFDLTAMQMMADKIIALQKWMPENLEQGIDWEYAHVLWRRDPPSSKEDWKPALLDPGTMKIANFMQVRFRHEILEKEIDVKTMNLRYVLKAEIVPYLPTPYFNPVANKIEFIYPVVAEGVGSTSTREKKYKTRWVWQRERDLITTEGFRPEELKQYREQYPDRYEERPNDKRGNMYYMSDSEALGLDNTLLKMAAKRAEMDAVAQLPGVAQRFSQEADLDGNDVDHKPKSAEDRDDGKDKSKSPGKKVVDFVKPAELKPPEWDVRDELNRTETSWDEGEGIVAGWMKEAGFNMDDFKVEADAVKIQVKAVKAIPVEMMAGVNGIMLANGFIGSRGNTWRLNQKDVVQ